MIRKIAINRCVAVCWPSCRMQCDTFFARRIFRTFHLIKSLLLSFSAVCFCTPSAWADTSSDLLYEPSIPEFYVGARAGYTYKHHACADIAIECDRDDAGYGLFAGYKPWSHFGLELSANNLGDATGDYSVIVLEGEIKTVDLSVIYTRDIYRNLSAFGKLGVAYWDGKVTGWEEELSDSGMRPLFGVGLQLPLSDHIDGRFEYQYLDQLGNHWMGYTDAHFLSFSLVWQFSAARKTLSAKPESSHLLKNIQSPNTILENNPSTLSLVKPGSTGFPTRVSRKAIHHYVELALSDFIARS